MNSAPLNVKLNLCIAVNNKSNLIRDLKVNVSGFLEILVPIFGIICGLINLSKRCSKIFFPGSEFFSQGERGSY